MLESMRLFSGVSSDAAAFVARHTRSRRLRPNTLVCTQGKPGKRLYMIRSGQVKRFLTAEDGRQIVLEYLGPGEHFGEIPLVTGGPEPASVAALVETDLLALSRGVFQQVLSSHPVVLGNLVLILAQRLAALTEAFASIALDDCHARVVRVLDTCAVEDGDRRITPPLTQRDIAQRIGCSREMVSRVLTELRSGGYLGSEGRRIVLVRTLPRRR